MDDKQRLQLDKEALNLGNLRTLTFDLDLPAKGMHGTTIFWKTSDQRFIDSTGVVRRPKHGMGNRNIILTAVLTIGDLKTEKAFKATVLQLPLEVKIDKVLINSTKQYRGEPFYLPNWLPVLTDEGQIISLAVKWPEQQQDELQFAPGEYCIQGSFQEVEFVFEFRLLVIDKPHRESILQEKVKFTPISNVTLKPGSLFAELQQGRLKFFLNSNPDDYLYNLRDAAGMNTKSGRPLIGWDAPNSLLRGHTTGHYLSGLALCFAATKNLKILDIIDYLVSSLDEIQQTFSAKVNFHYGYLGAYDETQFDQLEAGATYPDIWAPYYTLHKILNGLIDIYTYCGDEEALDIALKIGDWVNRRLARLSHQQLNRMWETYIAGEFGGMNESLARLTEITGNKKYSDTAKLFNNDRLTVPLKAQIDALAGLHANQHIPQVTGLLEMYKTNHDWSYFEEAQFFCEDVIKHHTYVFGGIGKSELFHEKDKIGQLVGEDTAETCATYNMLKLTKNLFEFEPKSSFMEYYENATFNHIAASSKANDSGGSTYFMPTGFGQQKQFDTDNTCCHGTGLENHFKYGEAVCAFDKQTVWINLPIPVDIKDPVNQVWLNLEVDLNRLSGLKLEASVTTHQRIMIRIPAWATVEEVRLNGEIQNKINIEDDYLVISAGTGGKEVVEIDWRAKQIFEHPCDNSNLYSLKVGPYVMAVVTDETNPVKLSRNLSRQDIPQPLRGSTVESGNKQYQIIPLCCVTNEKYQLYFQLH